VNKKYLETIKIIDGVAQNLEYHQWRLESVVATLQGSWRYDLSQLLNPPKKGLYRCRFVYDGDTYSQEYFAYTKRQVNSLKLISNKSIEYSKKYENRDALNALFTLRESCDDILIVQDGFVRDTSIANIAFYDGKEWVTPKKPLLKGTCRQRMLEGGKITTATIRVEDIMHFKRVALMNAMIDFDIITKEKIEDIIC